MYSVRSVLIQLLYRQLTKTKRAADQDTIILICGSSCNHIGYSLRKLLTGLTLADINER